MPNVEVTWLGHAAFRIQSPSGKIIYLDPWLTNPKAPASESDPDRIDILAITHGHGDHIGEAVELGKKHSPKVVAIFELASWLASQGVPNAADLGMNKGGTVDVDGVKFTMTNALHSSGFMPEGEGIQYLGDPAGFVIEFENGTTLYAAGDTAVFGDMALIARIYRPEVAILPIGDHFTMGPKEAAVALELLGVDRCIPCHYGTFPALAGSPQELRELVPSVTVMDPAPGETVMI